VGAVTFGAENEGLTVFAVELTLEFVASSFISAGLSTVGNVPFENSFSGRDACLGASAAGPGSKSGGAAALDSDFDFDSDSGELAARSPSVKSVGASTELASVDGEIGCDQVLPPNRSPN
jgi:hypothetical protein